MEKFTVDGIVIRASVTGESDRILWILTRDRGIIRAFAKGSRSIKSRLHAASSVFAYCSFTFTEKKGVFTVNEAEIREVFIPLRESLEKLSLAQYFCEVLLFAVPEGCPEDYFLRVLLNALYLLCHETKPALLIKSVFELRTAAECGYMPALVACDVCGEFLTDEMFFSAADGKLFCENCGRSRGIAPVPAAVVMAMRHIVFSEFEKAFSFELSAELLPVLNALTEKYLALCTRKEFRTLGFLKNQ